MTMEKRAKISLNDVTAALETSSAVMVSYLDLETGKIFVYTEDLASVIDDEVDMEEIPEWQRDDVRLARILEDDPKRFLRLPDSFEFHEYRHMERFILSLDDKELSDRLYRSIKGKGAFRRFKSAIGEANLFEQWSAYKKQRLKDAALAWCEEHNLECVE